MPAGHTAIPHPAALVRARGRSSVSDVLHLPPVWDPTLDDARAAFALETVVAPRSQRAQIILLVEVRFMRFMR